MASLPGSDFGGLSEGGFDDKGSEASGPVAEQISFDLSKPCTCALCQKTSVSESPLTSSHPHDKHGSRIGHGVPTGKSLTRPLVSRTGFPSPSCVVCAGMSGSS